MALQRAPQAASSTQPASAGGLLIHPPRPTALPAAARKLPGPPRKRGATRAAAQARPAPSSAVSQPAAAMQWLPWRSGDAEPEPEPEQASGLLGGLLTWGGGASAARQPAPQPAKSKTGTQQLLPWQRPGGTTETSGAAAAAKPGSALLSLWRSWDEGDSSSSRAEPQPEKPSVPHWRLPGTTAQQAAAAAPARPAAPIVSLAGGGIFYFWEAGVVKYLDEHFDLSKVQLYGASAGGLIATLAACGVSQDKAIDAAYRLSVEADIWNRPGGLAGIWGPLVRQWLDELLPEDAAERCNGRVKLVVTEIPSLRLRYIDNFATKRDLLDANMASIHIPWLLDGKPVYTCSGGRQWMDGSLYDFLFGNNSNLLTCDGNALVIDYFNDDQLQFSRLDFVKLADIEQVRELERCGYRYAERCDMAGQFDYYLSSVRKGAVRRWLIDYPVRRLTSAFV